MPQHERRLDRVTAPGYLDGIDARPVDELRAMRTEASEIETEVSYVRRLAQARIEIVEAEIERRSTGESLSELIARLPQILADPGPRAGAAQARVVEQLAPDMSIKWTRGLERLISDDTLANLPTLSEDELRAAIEGLRELEAETSATRRTLHGVIDALEREVAQRLAADVGGS